MALFLLLVACEPAPPGESAVGTTDDTGIRDVRVDPPTAPAEGFQILTAEMVVPAYSDSMFCYVGTYTGPTVGVQFYEWIQDPEFGHHVVFADGSDIGDVADGDSMDCSDPWDAMKLPPLLTPTATPGDHSASMTLGSGMAVRLVSGQRWVIQSHYVNTSARPLLARDVVNVGVVPEEDVNFWVGSWTFNDSLFEIAPKDHTQLSFVCPWKQDVEILALMGHMHSYGAGIDVQHVEGEQSTQVYHLNDWNPDWQSEPVFNYYERGEFKVKAGDGFGVTCDFDNQTDKTVTFPEEMCVASGLAGPLIGPIECDAGYL